ncbi:replication protein A 70 kDa DNA-binding subunit B [Tanacetum coccineum]
MELNLTNITQLCDIDPMIDDLKVLGRCISLWKCHPAGRPTEVYAMDMVFQDAQGNRVQATVRNKNISKFQLLIDEGSCYRIGNFGVGDNGGNYPLLNHRFKMNFYKNTSVTRVGNFDNNTRGFKFEPFANFSTKEFSPSDVVDVIGTVVSMTDCIPFNTFGVDKIRRTLILEDVDGVKLECCFFDAWAKKFDNFYEQRESLGHVVMILQLAKVKYFNKKPSVSNAIFSTKLFINDDIPEVAAFRQRYTLVEGYDPKQKIISLFSPVKRELTPQEFFQGAIKKMVGSIREAAKGFHCILYARIHKIHREHGWAYLACKKCGRIAKQADDGMKLWNCTVHKGIKETCVGIRYKVIIRVIDDNPGSACASSF